MKRLFTGLLLLTTLGVYSQSISKVDIDNEIKPIKENIIKVEKENTKLKHDIETLGTKLSIAISKLDSLKKMTSENSLAISKTNTDLALKITTTETNANQMISEVDQSLSRTTLWGIIGVLLAIVISGALYWLTSKHQKSDKTDLIDQLSKTKASIEESLVKEFAKQTGLMDEQLHLIEQQKTNALTKANTEPDHSLALKLASEINLIERNISLMDSKTKGLKQLVASVGKLKDNLLANGYEMPELLGKQFHQGMKVIVSSSVLDENLEKDFELITKILIPQVNYNDKMIQTAQIETSRGY